MADFTESAKGLSRNPLGIIALFISFVYALACIVIGASASTLESKERIPLIYFVIFFPVITLGCFVFLVVFHHPKLYAPKDYSKDESFLSTVNKTTSNKLASVSDNTSNAEKTDIENINVNLIYSSFYGATVLYTMYLSKKYNRPFTLKAVKSYCPYLEIEYSYGFLVAARSIGALKYTIDERGTDAAEFDITTTYLDKDIEDSISEQVYLFAEDFPKIPELKEQLTNLRNAFSSIPEETVANIPNLSSQTPLSGTS